MEAASLGSSLGMPSGSLGRRPNSIPSSSSRDSLEPGTNAANEGISSSFSSSACIIATIRRNISGAPGATVAQQLGADEAEVCYACTGVDAPVCSVGGVSEASSRPGQNHRDDHIQKAGSEAGSMTRGIFPFANRRNPRWGRTHWWFGRVLDPRTRRMRMWTRFFFMTFIVAISVDPGFLYLLGVDRAGMCVYMKGSYALIISVLRSVTDVVYLIHMSFQVRTAYISKESLVLGQGELISDARQIFQHYRKSWSEFWLDLYVVLPIPQLIVWLGVQEFLKNGRAGDAMGTTHGATLIGLVIVVQYFPKVWHAFRTFRRSQLVNGFVFGTAWGGFALNLAGYIISAHVFGALWYLLATSRVADCIRLTCLQSGQSQCSLDWVTCPNLVDHGPQKITDAHRLGWIQNSTVTLDCSTTNGAFDFGIYSYGVKIVCGAVWKEKVIYGLFFGLMTLSSFGNALQPSGYFPETIFAVLMITSGLLLFMLLIGNIQVFLNSLSAGSEHAQMRQRSLEWWMRRRQIPPRLRQRVRRYERAHYVATRGIGEEEILTRLPDSLRRDIKGHLCLPLVKKVPLFARLDAAVLDNICDRLKPVLYIENTVLVQEGEPVRQMLFIVRGKLQSNHVIGYGRASTCVLGESNFCGEELLTWCLTQHVDGGRLPRCMATLTTISNVEGFSLSAEDLHYVMSHFGTNLGSKKLKSLIRYYSPHWRTWAAVNIQLAWRCYKASKAAQIMDRISEHGMERMSMGDCLIDAARRGSHCEQERMRVYAAIFTAPKPHE